MYYEEKMLNTFADGIYCACGCALLCVAVVSLTQTAPPCADDNTYFNTDYHPIPGPGYVADTDECDDGALHAGVGLWDLREMVRRSSVLQHTLGRRFTSLMFHVRAHHSVRLCVVVCPVDFRGVAFR